jgi:hypothetical protein
MAAAAVAGVVAVAVIAADATAAVAASVIDDILQTDLQTDRFSPVRFGSITNKDLTPVGINSSLNPERYG